MTCLQQKHIFTQAVREKNVPYCIQDSEHWRSADSKAKRHHCVCQKVCSAQWLMWAVYLIERKHILSQPMYQSEKLKAKLEHTYGEKMTFCSPNITGKFITHLVFNLDMKLERAVQRAFLLGTEDNLAEAARSVRRVILNAHEKEFWSSRVAPKCWPYGQHGLYHSTRVEHFPEIFYSWKR